MTKAASKEETITENVAMEELPHDASHLVSHIKASAKEIWLAGLGAFSQNNDRSAGLFQQLVKEGKDLEKVSREHLDRQIQQVRNAAIDRVDEVKEKAADSIGRLENVFDERVSKAAKRLGIAMLQDQEVLEKKIDGLEHRLRDLESILADQQKSKAPKSR